MAVKKYSAFTKDGAYKYDIGSERGIDFVENAAPGSGITGGDGSSWTKNGDGTTTIRRDGLEYVVARQGGYSGAAPKTAAVSATAAAPAAVQTVTPSAPKLAEVRQYQPRTVETVGLKDALDAWKTAGERLTAAKADQTVREGEAALRESEAAGLREYQAQRRQIDAGEVRALDNQALYAERRGDRGGIGASQYDSIRAAAAQSRAMVNQAQTALSADTARQIAALRAKGEFQKADAVLDLAQTYLTRLTEMEKWAAEYDLNAQRFAAQLSQWDAEHAVKLAELTGNYQGVPTLDAQRQSAQREEHEAELTGYYRGLPTLDAQRQQLQRAAQEAELTGLYNGSPTAEAQRQAAQREAQQEAQRAQEAAKAAEREAEQAAAAEKAAQTAQKALADAGLVLAKAGIRPSAGQRAAMGSYYGYTGEGIDALVAANAVDF